MMKKNLSIFLMVIITGTSYAQLQKTDSVLYLWFQEGHNYKGISPRRHEGGKKRTQKFVVEYSLTSVSNLYDGYPLDFQSIKPPDTVRIGLVKHKITVSVDQLSNFIKDNYPDGSFGGGPYFDKLKKIYILENTPCKGFITITRVRVSTHRGD